MISCNKPQQTRVIALIMAAGKSRRFGDDKRRALLPNGRTLLQTTQGLAQHAFFNTWIVLRQEDNPALLGVANQARIIHAPGTDIGLGTSLATAFGRLAVEEETAQAAAILLGDMPWVSYTTCQHLIERAHPERIICPRHGGRNGHPVVFGRMFWPQLACLNGDQGARSVLRAHASACEIIDVNDPGIHHDIDIPADLDFFSS